MKGLIIFYILAIAIFVSVTTQPTRTENACPREKCPEQTEELKAKFESFFENSDEEYDPYTIQNFQKNRKFIFDLNISDFEEVCQSIKETSLYSWLERIVGYDFSAEFDLCMKRYCPNYFNIYTTEFTEPEEEEINS